MSDIFNEVDEEVRREQLKKLWERYGNLIIAAAFLIVAGVAAWRGYEYWQARKAAEAGAVYESALKLSDEGKHTEAEDAFGKLGRAAARQQVAGRVQVGVAERDAFGDLLRTAGLDEY